MIRITPTAVPLDFDFDKRVRQPGLNAMKELIGDLTASPRRGPKREAIASTYDEIHGDDLPDFWTRALPALRKAYRGVCAYLGMRIHVATGLATVDHFRPKSKYQTQAYEWENFRLAAHQVNTNKGNYEDVLDAFEIQDGWFVLNVGTFEVEPAKDLDPTIEKRVCDTITRLKLNEPTFCDAREEYHDRYHGLGEDERGPRTALPFGWLEEECPFVAAELVRQNRLRVASNVPEGGRS